MELLQWDFVVPGYWTSKTGYFCLPVVLFFICSSKRYVTWVCCRKVIWQLKFPFSIYTFKVKTATLWKKSKFSLMVIFFKKSLLKRKIHTYIFYLHVHRFWTGFFKWGSLSSTFFQHYSDGMTFILKNSSACEMGSFHASKKWIVQCP